MRIVVAAVLLVLAARIPAASASPPTPEDLLAEGRAAFHAEEDFVRAEARFRAVVEHPDATSEQRARAGFYVFASLGRQERRAEAVAYGETWVAAYPRDASVPYVLYFIGTYEAELGHDGQARTAWLRVVRDAPGTDLARMARSRLGVPEGDYVPGRRMPVEPDGEGGTVVVLVALGTEDEEDVGFRRVAEAAATFHHASQIEFDAQDFDGLRRSLASRNPENVIFVVRPERLDIAFQRRVLLLSRGLDDDVFPDFCWGYLVARDAGALGLLWKRTLALHEQGLASKRWVATAVTSGPKAMRHEGSVPDLARASGFQGEQLYWAFPARDPEALEFLDENLPRLQSAGVVTMTGNGDPEGIWLFDDHRNAEPEKHWAYAPERVGEDPAGEMPRILADRFRALELRRTVVWSGTCHSGATGRVFVEGDIVSTFGRTDVTTVYRMPPERSLCLALLDAGAAAFLCPLGANHGMSVSREAEFALASGATLGETIKSTYDDVCLAALDDLVLDLPVEGAPHERHEAVMQGGGANRALIGDPTLVPFDATPHPLETTTAKRREDGVLEVQVVWKPGWHAGSWDMFGTDRAHPDCIRTRLPLADLLPADWHGRFSASVQVEDGTGRVLPFVMRRAEPEVFHGRRYLHLQANVARMEGLRGRELRATFLVRVGD